MPPASDSPGESGRNAAQPLSPVRLQHHESVFIEALRLLIDTGKAQTHNDLLRYAEQAKQPQAAEFLRSMAGDALPVDLAFDALYVHTRIVAHKRNNGLLQSLQDRRIGLLMPLPPHLLDAFLSFPQVTFLVPDGHPLVASLRDRAGQVVEGNRACRAAVEQLDVIVFEAHKVHDEYQVDASVADVVDPRILPAAARLVVQLRPHKHPNDVPLPAGSPPLSVL